MQSDQKEINNTLEISTEETKNNEENNSKLQDNLERQMGESVVSEYVFMDSQMIQSPRRFTSDMLGDSSDSSDEIVIPEQKRKKNKIKKQTSDPKSSTSEYQEDSSNKTTSEMNALNNIREQQIRKPIFLNVMVVGESGLGKSTFIDIFLSKKFRKQEPIRPSTQYITDNKGTRVEGNIHFNINMIDTPGYTAGINLKSWYQEIRNYILEQFEKYQAQEERVIETKFQNFDDVYIEDSRVHACLYFLQGPRIKKTDMAIMKKLQKYVNVIPILAKGDSFTKEEVQAIKQTLNEDAAKYGISWFDIKKAMKHNPEYIKKLNDGPHGIAPPFLMISSVKRIEIKPNLWVFGRNYQWGVCNVENPDHSDFNLLYSLLVGHLSLELIDQTKYYCHQYFKQKKMEEKAKLKEEEDKMQYVFKGTLVTIGLALTSFFLYPVNKTLRTP